MNQSRAEAGEPSKTTADTVTFGRTLVDGEPVDNGLTLPVDSPTVELLAAASSPLISQPQLGEYGAVQKGLATVFGPVGRLLRYSATHPGYSSEAFWEARVEQFPDQ